MSTHSEIRRYFLVIEKIRHGKHPSFREIKEYLYQQGFQIADRTLQRDIEQIRYDFGVEITYDRTRNGYWIDPEASINLESFFHFMEIVNTAQLLTESLHESKDALRHISFGTGGGLEGIENLKPLLAAIRECKIIHFSHYNFATEKTTQYVVKPYLLREYQNRWYVVGIVEKIKKLRIFGIDRISHLVVTPHTYNRDPSLNPSALFKQTIGLVFSSNSLQEVVLSFTPIQGKYVKTLPWHTSQRVLIDNEQECRISLHVIPNFELTQEILKHGSSVKVVKPEWLAHQVRTVLEEALNQYKHEEEPHTRTQS